MTNEMIERLAREAYCASEGIRYDANVAHVEYWFDAKQCAEDGYDCEGDMWRKVARAVLKELMTPTDEMANEGRYAICAESDTWADTPDAARACWVTMLTTALEENP